MHAMAVGLMWLTAIGVIFAITIIVFLVKKEYTKIAFLIAYITLLALFVYVMAVFFFAEELELAPILYTGITLIGFIVLYIKLKTKITLGLLVIGSAIALMDIGNTYIANYYFNNIDFLTINFLSLIIIFSGLFLSFAINSNKEV